MDVEMDQQQQQRQQLRLLIRVLLREELQQQQALVGGIAKLASNLIAMPNSVSTKIPLQKNNFLLLVPPFHLSFFHVQWLLHDKQHHWYVCSEA